MGRVRCPVCNGRFRLPWTAKYWGLLILSCIVFAAAPAIGVLALGGGPFYALLTYIGLAVLVGMPIGKVLDQKVRPPIPVNKDTGAQPSAGGDAKPAPQP